MTKSKLTKILTVGISLFCLVIGGALLYYQPWSTRRYSACVISINEGNALLRFDIPTDELSLGSLYYIKTAEATFTSHDNTIKTIEDLIPGALVNVTIKNLDISVNLTMPSIPDMKTITKIDAYGKTDEKLFQAGINDLDSLGYSYEDGQIVSRMKFD